MPFSSWEMASRLSYLMWNSMPDRLALQAAAADRVEDQRAMLTEANADVERSKDQAGGRQLSCAMARTRQSRERFQKRQGVYPAFSERIARAACEPRPRCSSTTSSGTVRPICRRSSRRPTRFMNAPLATFYGVRGPSGDGFQRVTLDPSNGWGSYPREPAFDQRPQQPDVTGDARQVHTRALLLSGLLLRLLLT